MKKFSKLISVLLTTSLVLAGCGNTSSNTQTSSTDPVTLRMSYSLTAGSPCDVAAQKFKEIVAEKTDGRINIELYPNCGLSGGDLVKALIFTAHHLLQPLTLTAGIMRFGFHGSLMT